MKIETTEIKIIDLKKTRYTEINFAKILVLSINQIFAELGVLISSK